MRNRILRIFFLLALSVTSLFARQIPEFEVQFKLGNQRMEEKDYDGAIGAFSECLRLSPKQPSCYANRGLSYRQKSNFSRAIADYTEALKYAPNSAKYFNLRAQAYQEEKKYDSAIADYTQAIKNDPNNISYYKRRADAFYEIEKYDLVVADLKSASKIDPEDAQVKRLLDIATKIAAKTKEIAEKREQVEAGQMLLGVLFPQQAEESFKRGKAQFEKKEAGAIQSFSECLRVKPDFADCYFYRGQVYEQERQYEKAVADFTEAIKLQPQNIEYYRKRAYTNDFWLDRYDPAIADLGEVIKLQPKDSRSYLARGFVFRRKKDYQKAAEDFTSAIDLESSKSFYEIRADLYSNELKNYNAAIADYTEVIRLDPKEWMNYHNRARVYLKNKNYEKAIVDFSKTIELGTVFAGSAYEERAQAYCASGSRTLAAADEKKAKELGQKISAPCGTPVASSSGCPVIKIKSPTSVLVGKPIILIAEVTSEQPDFTTYNWQLSKGMIEKGQGTSEITIDTAGIAANEKITVKLDVGGYERQCIKETYGHTRTIMILKK